MVKNGSKKKGSISILMVIVIPTLMIASIVLYQFLMKNQRENERLKLLQHASELQLTEYHTYLMEEYGLLGYYKGNGLEGIYKTLLEANAFKVPKTFEIEETALSHPLIYEQMALETAKTLMPITVVQGMKQFIENQEVPPEDEPVVETPAEEPFEGEKPEKPEEVETVEDREKDLKNKVEGKEDASNDIIEIDWKKSNGYSSKLTLLEQIMIKEYYLGTYTSLDEESPRNIDLMGRKERGDSRIEGEIEYLIAGKTSDKANQSTVWREIYLIRGVTNAIHLATCPSKQKVITAFHASLPPPWGSIAAASVAVLWSGAESYIDMEKLMRGESLLPIKTEAEWALDFDSLLSGDWSGNKPAAKAKGKWFYFDYLRSLLYLENTERVIMRSMNLVEGDLNDKSEGQVGLAQLIFGHKVIAEFEDGTRLQFEASYP